MGTLDPIAEIDAQLIALTQQKTGIQSEQRRLTGLRDELVRQQKLMAEEKR